jgi:hypothetical protein
MLLACSRSSHAWPPSLSSSGEEDNGSGATQLQSAHEQDELLYAACKAVASMMNEVLLLPVFLLGRWCLHTSLKCIMQPERLSTRLVALLLRAACVLPTISGRTCRIIDD